MLTQEIVDSAMDYIPNLMDRGEVFRATNNIISQINGVIDGIRDKQEVIIGGLSPTSGYVWNKPFLTLHSIIKEVIEVWVESVSTDKKARSTYHSKNYVESRPDDNLFCMPSRNLIQFASRHDIISDTEFKIILIAKITFDRISVTDPPDTIDIPETWEAAFISGVISLLTIKQPYRDMDLHNVHKEIFRQLLSTINHWEISRYPMSSKEQQYNYHSPGR